MCLIFQLNVDPTINVDIEFSEHVFVCITLSVHDEGYSRNVRDEGYSRNVRGESYSRNVRDEGYSRNVRDEGYSRNVRDEGYSRNASCALILISAGFFSSSGMIKV